MLLDCEDMEFLRGKSGAELESLCCFCSPSLVDANLLQFSEPNFLGSVLFQLSETLFEGGVVQFFGSNFRGNVLQFLFGRVSFLPRLSYWLTSFKLSLRPKLPPNSFLTDFCFRMKGGEQHRM